MQSPELPNKHGSELWSQGPGSAEMLHVRFPQLSSAGIFFQRFLADSADFTFLDGKLPPWYTAMPTSEGELDQWNEDKTRKLRLRAHPVEYLGMFPFLKNPSLKVEEIHQYQFLTDSSTGAEMLQFQCEIRTRDSGGLPYVGAVIIRQLWTVRPVSDSAGSGVCELHVTAEVGFVGRPPMIASFLQQKYLAENRAGASTWLRGAHASLERLEGHASKSPAALDLDDPAHAATSPSEQRKHGYCGRRLTSPCLCAWLAAFLLCVFCFVIQTVDVFPDALSTGLEPSFRSVLLTWRSLLSM